MGDHGGVEGNSSALRLLYVYIDAGAPVNGTSGTAGGDMGAIKGYIVAVEGGSGACAGDVRRRSCGN